MNRPVYTAGGRQCLQWRHDCNIAADLSRRRKHLGCRDIPTPSCDRPDAAFTFHRFDRSLSEGNLGNRQGIAMSLPLKVFVATLAAAFVFASPADAAKKSKHKKTASTSTTRADTQHRGTNLFPAGPLYFSGVYLGDDPDPNIRFQIWRDISGRFGGEQ